MKKLKIEKKEKMEDVAATKVEQLEEKLKSEVEKINDLKKTVECPVCLEVPRKGPIFTCPNGHLVCQKCKRGSCPMCREVMGDYKSLVAVEVIGKILHDCKFAECEEKFPLNQVEEHEKVCKHRVVSCPYYFCVERMPLFNLVGHLETSPSCCSNSTPIVVDGYGSSWAIAIKNNLKSPEESEKPRQSLKVKYFCFEGHFFALTVNKVGDYWRFVIVMFESPEVCSEYNIELQVYEISSSDTRLSAKACCHPCSIDQTVAQMEGFGLVVHHNFMKEMMLKEDGFKFIVSFLFSK